MDWVEQPVNDFLKDDITKLNYTLLPPGFQGDVRNTRLMQQQLSKVIDQLGERSAAAQGLNKVITTAERLRNTPTHNLYLLKDPEARGGAGEVVGLLKTGRKHLFLFDQRAKVCEVEPLCVLDFFVVPDRQRHGLGRMLFDHMLQDTNTTAHQLAIDGPSAKMEQFLNKNYGVARLVRQNNNFAISPRFFQDADEISAPSRSPSAPAPAVGRFAAHQPASAIATVIHGGASYFNENKNSRGAAPLDSWELGESPAEPERSATPASEENWDEELARLDAELERARIATPPRPATPPPRPATLSAPPAAPPALPAAAASPAGSTAARRDSQLTDKGYFDVKFYHNKLW